MILKEEGDMWRSDEPGYFHICTDGNAVPWIFQDDEDFIAGVNRIGICAIITGVDTVAYVLMDNHGHFIMYGTLLACKRFINTYKVLTGKHISRKYNIKDPLRDLPVEIIPIKNEEELMATIAYVDRNPVVAGFKFLPNEYRWGSARYIFKEFTQDGQSRRLGDIGLNARRRLLKTRTPLPEDWEVDCHGMLIPCKSFLKSARLENIFKTPIRYNFFLAKKLEGNIEMTQGYKTFLPDKELRPVAAQIAMTLFGTSDIKSLNVRSRLRIARELRHGYAATVKQVSRMVYLDTESLNGFI